MDDKEKQPYNIELFFASNEVKEYVDIIGYQVSGTVVAIMTKDGETLVYPLASITFIRHYPQAA
jgi:hypothetical protein